MTFTDLLTTWSDNPGLSVFIWALLLITAMYLGRSSAHHLISSLSRSLRGVMRMTATSLVELEDRMSRRNKEVILQEGQHETERAVEREFQRVNKIVERDLGAFPSIQRKITDTINSIEGDYQNSNETPPSPPEWLEAVETISKIQRNGDSTVDQILANIQDSIEKAHDETIKAYRKSSLEKLNILKKMLPSWRSLSGTLAVMDKSVTDLSERSEFIDKQMTSYVKIRAQDDMVTRALASSSMTQFFIAALILGIAIMGGVINFQLIALPMSEMVGGTATIAGWKTADIAAMVIIMVEVAMGVFLLEALQITHLFDLIQTMDDKMRKRMVVITLLILTILATVEASLAYMRDLLALDREALTQSLAGVAASNVEFRWIPSIGQMVMGFILPFALAFVAIPLESFIHSSRTVIGLISSSVIRALIYVFRLVGQFTWQAGKVLTHAYDMVIFLPLSVEQIVKSSRRNGYKEKDIYVEQTEKMGGVKS